ncbi:MAG: ClC family H(+)/Cl(-) exchange transporter [Anaerovoracaceae bacterium]|jgi:H+/Cl- antiporter ClcA
MFSLFKKTREETVSEMLKATSSLKFSMIIHSFFIGLVGGLVIVAYRLLGEHLLGWFAGACAFVKGNIFHIALLFLGLVAVSLVVTFCVKQEPNISGSGIPQVEGMIARRMHTDWKKVLFYKFFGGLLALGAGLSVGREGPSIQMGAAVGQGVSNVSRKMDHEHKYLITAGAAAGLAAAFNAPLAGVMFALEEVHKNFSPIVLVSAMVSAVTADVVAKVSLGMDLVLRFELPHFMPLKYYWTLLLLGILVGLSSFFFNNGLLLIKHLYQKMPGHLALRIMIPFLLAGILGLTFPILLGGGHKLIMDLPALNLGLWALLAILVAKYLFTFLSFGSGVPGGIFLPLLALGAIMGNLFGVLVIDLGIPREFLLHFIVLAMAGHFAAIVKAPITGMILVIEMTGSFAQLLPLTVVVFTALITSDLLRVPPVYEMLLEDILKGKTTSDEGQGEKKTLIELPVHVGSQVEGKCISQVPWPENCLVVSVYRGSTEIIPKGNTRLRQGDLLLFMVNRSDSAAMLDHLTGLTTFK